MQKMNDKLIRAGQAHDEVTAAFADIFGEGLANNWFRQTQLILKEQLNKAGLLASDAGEEAPDVDLEAEYKRMQDEAAAELDRMAPKAPKAVEVATAVSIEDDEAEKQASIEAEKQAAIEAEKQAAIEAEKQAAIEAEKQAAIEAEKQAAIEAEKQAAIEAEKQAVIEAEKQAAIEAEKQAVEEAAKKAEEEAAKRVKVKAVPPTAAE
jgi:hypothetical protein